MPKEKDKLLKAVENMQKVVEAAKKVKKK